MIAIAMAAAALRKSDGRAIALAEHGLPSWLVPTLWVAAVECVDIYAYAHVRTHLYRTVIDSIRYRICTYSVRLVCRPKFSRARNSVRIGHPFTLCCSSCCCMGALPFADAVGRPHLGAIEESEQRAEVGRDVCPWGGTSPSGIHEYLSYS